MEIAGGSVRIHDPEVQSKVFKALAIDEAEQRAKFGFFLDALSFGAPPHAGIAAGMDRLSMLIAGAQSLRDVIPFPKTQKGTDLMSGAPTRVSPKQLEELFVKSIPPEVA
jgi:aspartyl-tRNA synthetase